MLKNNFETQPEFDVYITEQKVRKENKYLTVSERKQLEEMIQNPKNYIHKSEVKPVGLPIITNLDELHKPCAPIEKGDNIVGIIKDLKDTLANSGGLGLTANQIGINKRISYVKIPKPDTNNKIEYNEYILINAKIIEKEKPVKVQNEFCLSFSRVSVTTERFIFIIVQYYNEKMEIQTGIFQDLEALVIQHEIDHTNGLTIFDRKWRSR